MTKPRLRHFLFSLLLIAAGIMLIRYLYPRIHPLAGIGMPYTHAEMLTHVQRIADSLDINTDDHRADLRLRTEVARLRQQHRELGLKGSIDFSRAYLPADYWRVNWVAKDPPDPGESARRQEIEDGLLISRPLRRWQLDVRGRLLIFERAVDDSIPLPHVTAERAVTIARDFLHTYTPFRDSEMRSGNSSPNTLPVTFHTVSRIDHPNRIDYRLNWRGRVPELDDPLDVRVVVSGNRVSSMNSHIVVPDTYSEELTTPLNQIISSMVTILLAVLTIVLAFKLWRAYELSFRFSGGIGLVIGVLFAAVNYAIAPNWTLIFPALFIGGTFVFVWAVGESLGRSVWNEKFISLDLLRNGHFFHSRIGLSVMNGLLYGILAFVAWLILTWLPAQLTTIQIINSNVFILSYLATGSPFWMAFGMNVFFTLFTVTAYVLLGFSFLQRYIRRPAVLALLMSLFIVIAHQSTIEPFWWGIIIDGAMLILLMSVFFRFDILACFLAFLTANFLDAGTSFFFLDNSLFVNAGYYSLTMLGLGLIYTLLTFLTRDRISDFERITPTYLKNITERQRLQRELEIAREVQMSFLPQSTPQINSLDLASRCEPALEVGGDYFDFVEIDDHRLGVVIGDVSGKGTQAAFYMTLTKGFWRALASGSDSPADVLTKLNRLFYDNVKRGVFISMVYGVFDLQQETLTLARAGHNPVIVHKRRESRIDIIHPRGIALGMEKGTTFANTIQEVTISIRPDDVFVFYTDGLTEAMNRRKEEFGDERFERAIEKLVTDTAEQIIDGIFKTVRSFTGRIPQHDDMTIVVARIKENLKKPTWS